MRALALLFVSALLCGGAAAQDREDLPPDAKAPPDAAPAEQDADARLLLSQALKRLSNGADWVVQCDIRHETQAIAGGAAAVMIVGPTGSAPPFEGRVEAWQAEDGAVVVTSTATFPGFALYTRDGRTLKEATFDEEVPDLEQVRAELATILDRGRLARHLLDAGLKPTRDPGSGTVTFRGKIGREVVKPMRQGAAMGMMVKRVVGAEAEVSVSADGGIRGLTIRIHHSDPVQRMLKGGVGTMRIQLQGGVPVPMPGGGAEGEEDEKHDTPTGSTTYTLVPGRAPSERARAFRSRAEELLAAR